MQQAPSPKPWRTVLREQGRTITWLAQETGRPRRSIYAYSQGTMRPTAEWLALASMALGTPVFDERYPERTAA